MTISWIGRPELPDLAGLAATFDLYRPACLFVVDHRFLHSVAPVSAVTERPRFVSIKQSTSFVKDYIIIITGYKSFART